MADWGGLAGMLGAGGMVYSAYDRLGDVSKDYKNAIFGGQMPSNLADQALSQGKFTPWGVTSSVGTGGFGADGQLSMQLSPQQQAMQDQLMQQGAGFYNNAAMPTAQRETDIYGRIRAMQQPGELRNQQQMQAQLNAQGRGGIRSAQFGGSPEQFAMEKARAEAMNQASLQAMQQAQAEQMQQANIGTMYQQNAYLPLQAMLQSMNPALQSSQVQNQAQQHASGLWGQMAMGGLEGMLGSRMAQANLAGQLGSGLLSGMFTTSKSGDNYGMDTLSKLFSSWIK